MLIALFIIYKLSLGNNFYLVGIVQVFFFFFWWYGFCIQDLTLAASATPSQPFFVLVCFSDGSQTFASAGLGLNLDPDPSTS
jgi:hypothetical protein